MRDVLFFEQTVPNPFSTFKLSYRIFSTQRCLSILVLHVHLDAVKCRINVDHMYELLRYFGCSTHHMLYKSVCSVLFFAAQTANLESKRTG